MKDENRDFASDASNSNDRDKPLTTVTLGIAAKARMASVSQTRGTLLTCTITGVAIGDVVFRDDRVSRHILKDSNFLRTDDFWRVIALVDELQDDVACSVVKSVADVDRKAESFALCRVLVVERLTTRKWEPEERSKRVPNEPSLCIEVILLESKDMHSSE
ncbi:hypothetical protein RB195_008088 [Necator americanus]|uniref:Uncharacterized protein n=1 Tax=Necator americanus TaxID=51031 RepID=A0ABR1CPL6_NECAM